MLKVKKVVLLAFASNDLKRSINRLSNQARESNFYNEINKLEKTEVEEIRFSDAEEKYRIFILIALGLIFVEFTMRKLIFKSIV